MTLSTNDDNLANFPLSAYIVQRPRINQLLEQTAHCKLVYVIAGAGYGKTQAVLHFVEQQTDAVVRWMHLTESDNLGARYWENLAHVVSHDNPDLAEKLRVLGFPENEASFKRFAGILKRAEHRAHKTFLVLDDFHVIHNKQALSFAERCAHLDVEGACVIIISRQEPDINVVSLFAKGKAAIITEEMLRFTEQEIASFFTQCAVPFSVRDLPSFFDATKGWAIAVQLLSFILRRNPNNVPQAIENVRQNIFRLLELEAFSELPEPTQKALVSLSLTPNLPLMPMHKIISDVSFLRNTPQLISFMVFDSLSGTLRVHPLYLEFLQSRQSMLSDNEKDEVYNAAAQWCVDNGFVIHAVDYFAKLKQYERMLEVFLSQPFRMPTDACEHFLTILDELGSTDAVQYPLDYSGSKGRSIMLLRHLFIPLFLVGAGRFDGARSKCLLSIEEAQSIAEPESTILLYTAYSNLAYIDTYTCVATHDYTFAENLEKSIEYYMKSDVPPLELIGSFSVADVRAFACLVGEGAKAVEFEYFLESAKKTAQSVAQTSHQMFYGYDELVACEFAFFKNNMEDARKHASNAILMAREKKQFSIEMVAQQYLLRIATHEGNFLLTKRILQQMDDQLENPEFWSRQLLHDLFTGHFYAQIGLHDRVPQWLIMDEVDVRSEVRIPVRELIVGAKRLIEGGRHEQALTVLINAYPRDPYERYAFGELTLTLLTAIAREHTGDKEGARTDFIRAFELACDGLFEVPFIEAGKSLTPLLAALAKSGDSGIPREWILRIRRKSGVYIKKTAHIHNAFRKVMQLEEAIHLTKREQEVLVDLYHGLSRDEIASNRYLSVNTVKKVLQSIYIKLGAGSSVDAVRIALERNLIE